MNTSGGYLGDCSVMQDPQLVRMAGEKYHKNRSVCAKSMKFGTLIVFDMLNRMRGSAKLNSYFLSNGC